MTFHRKAAQHFLLLRKPAYSLYFFGQLISMSGSFMQAVAQGWLVYKISGSSQWLGLIAFLTQFPAFLFSPLAGVFADQVNKKKLLLFVLAFSALQAMGLGTLVILGMINLWHLGLLAILLGSLNAFEMTTRHSLALDMVGRTQLPSAIALNSFLINGSRILGPLLAAFLVDRVGEGWCFILNSISYFFVMLSLIFAKFETRTSSGPFQIWGPFRNGFYYVKEFKELHFPLGFSALLGLIGSPYAVLLPVIAKDLLQGRASTLGYITAAHSFGALTGSLLSVELKPRTEFRHMLIQRLTAIGLCHIILALSTELWITSLALAGCGFFVIGSYPMINNFLQFKVSEQMRGRVLSIYTMTFLATLPLGGLAGGALAEALGAKITFFVVAGFSILVGLALMIRYRKSTNFAGS